MAQSLSEPLVSKPGNGSTFTGKKVLITFLGILLGFLIIIFLVRWALSTSLEVDKVHEFLLENPGPSNSLAFSRDNKILVIATESGHIQAWNLENNLGFASFNYPGKVKAVDITYDHEYIVASGDDKVVRVFSVREPLEVVVLSHPSQVTKFQLSPDSYSLSTACGDDKIRD